MSRVEALMILMFCFVCFGSTVKETVDCDLPSQYCPYLKKTIKNEARMPNRYMCSNRHNYCWVYILSMLLLI